MLAYLDGTAAPVTLDATLELRPPDLAPAGAPLAAASRVRLRSGRDDAPGDRPGHPRGRLDGASSRRERPPAGNNGRLTELTSSPETTRRRRTRAASAGEEDA